MVMGPTYSRQDLRSVSKDTYTDGYSRTPRCGLVGPLDSYCTRPALSSKFSNEEHADIGLGTRGITYFKSQLVKLNIKYFHSWVSEHYCTDDTWRRQPLCVEKQASTTRRSIGTIHSHSGAAPLTDRDACGARIPGTKSGSTSFRGFIDMVNSTSGRMDQERFITIKRARGVLECVKSSFLLLSAKWMRH